MPQTTAPFSENVVDSRSDAISDIAPENHDLATGHEQSNFDSMP